MSLAHLGVLAYGADDLLVARRVKIEERHLEALELRSDLGHVSECAAVDVIDTEDVRAGAEGLHHARGSGAT
jgi:hypothetical protein